MESTFKRNKSGQVTITFKDMTQGEALSLCHALDGYATVSPVCEDLEFSLNHAIQKAGKDDKDQELFEALPVHKHDQ